MDFLKHQDKLPEFLNNYLKYKNFILFNSDGTSDNAYYDLVSFFRYIKLKFYNEELLNTVNKDDFKEVDIKDITLDDMSRVTEDDIDKYISFLSNVLGNKTSTRNKKISATKKFFKHLSNNNLFPDNLSQNTEYGRTEKRLPKYLNLEESKILLSKTINSIEVYKIRNYAMICIFLNCALRVSELINIDIPDIKLDEGTIRITGKGDKQRILYLDEAVKDAIKEYMKVRQVIGYDNVDRNALFLSSRNKRISRRTVEHIVTEKLNECFEDKKGLHTHSLRHSSASMMHNINNTDIVILKKCLGHLSIAATQNYTHIDSKKLRYIMDNCTISSILEKQIKEEKSYGKW